MSQEVVVATLPARHRYVDAAVPPGARHLDRGRTLGWAPDPAWSAPALLTGADVVHVHFGFDHLDPADLSQWCGSLSAPLVVTVHDLRNPHHDDPRVHQRQLRVLLARADAVLTLTDRAAREIEREYGRSATVVPHGSVYGGPTAATEPGLVGLALKSLRRNLVAPAALARVVSAAVSSAGGRLVVSAHRDVADHPEVRAVDAVLRAAAAEPVSCHDYLDDESHRMMLSRLQVSVLPNRWGTHSGWLEAGRDVGTRVVAPSCGCYGQQGSAVACYGHDTRSGLDEGSLYAAVTCALADGPIAPVPRAVRAAQRAESDAVHRSLYADLLGRAAA